MAHTTTSTTTYLLEKYSRSYPSKDSAWQHFTNPVIRLALDVMKTGTSELRSVRLRVIWTIQNGAVITMNDNSEIVLEDLDLLSFSSLYTRQVGAASIPLRAVYRSTSVGIRYLYPLEDTNTTTFRRFQISFRTEQDTDAFINSIRSVCPCKMSPNPAAHPCPPTAMGAGSVTTQGVPQHSQFVSGQMHPQYAPNNIIPGRQNQVLRLGNTAGTCFSKPPAQIGHNSMPLPSQNYWSGLPSQHQVLVQQSSQSTMPWTSQINNQFDCDSQSLDSQVPDGVPLSSETEVATIHKSASSILVEKSNSEPHPIHAALKEATSIYDLSPGVLEQVVGDVLREDAFINLLEKLGKLWRVKRLLDC